MNPPCRDLTNNTDCPKRHAGCAATCPEWAEYVKVRNREYERRKNLGNSEAIVNNILFRRQSKSMREKIRKRKFKQG